MNVKHPVFSLEFGFRLLTILYFYSNSINSNIVCKI